MRLRPGAQLARHVPSDAFKFTLHPGVDVFRRLPLGPACIALDFPAQGFQPGSKLRGLARLQHASLGQGFYVRKIDAQIVQNETLIEGKGLGELFELWVAPAAEAPAPELHPFFLPAGFASRFLRSAASMRKGSPRMLMNPSASF